MSGELNRPLLAPAQAAVLLDEVIYERVIDCIDLDALASFEESLTQEVADLDGIDIERAIELVKSMIDRALRRVPDDPRRYVNDAWDGHCELCELEAAAPFGRPPDDKIVRQ